MENVYLGKIESYDIGQMTNLLNKALVDLGIFHTLKPKSKVLIVPTMTTAVSPDEAINTHPNVICALVNVLNGYGVKCILAGSPYKNFDLINLDRTYLETGMIDAENLSKFQLNHDLSTIRLDCDRGIKTKSLTLLGVINDVDAIINVNKLIFDPKLGYLGSTTNLFNLIPGELKTIILNRQHTLEDYYNYMLDMYVALQNKVKLNITDGVITREQDTQRMVSCVAISKDSLSLDSAVLDLFGVNTRESIIKLADDRGLISLNRQVKTIGDRKEDFNIIDYNAGELSLNSDITGVVAGYKGYFRSHQERVVIDGAKCKGCQVCARICPTGAISIELDDNGERYAKVDYKKCIFCNKCYTACPYQIVDIKTPHGYKSIKKEIDKFNN